MTESHLSRVGAQRIKRRKKERKKEGRFRWKLVASFRFLLRNSISRLFNTDRGNRSALPGKRVEEGGNAKAKAPSPPNRGKLRPNYPRETIANTPSNLTGGRFTIDECWKLRLLLFLTKDRRKDIRRLKGSFSKNSSIYKKKKLICWMKLSTRLMKIEFQR